MEQAKRNQVFEEKFAGSRKKKPIVPDCRYLNSPWHICALPFRAQDVVCAVAALLHFMQAGLSGLSESRLHKPESKLHIEQRENPCQLSNSRE